MLGSVGSITVAHRHSFPAGPLPERAVYIGRPSALGSPFPVGPGCSRAQSIASYRVWARAQFALPGPFRSEVLALAARVRTGHHLVLVCWCAPLPCHGCVLATAVRRLAALPA